MDLEDLKIYTMAMELGNKVWSIVEKWEYFHKDTIGKQMVRSSDSVAANISEGYGRFHFKDSKKFYYYSRGSLYETKTWLSKALQRDLINTATYEEILKNINTLGKMLNAYIKSIGTQKLNEPEEPYKTDN
ncbi:MAG: four helix bundle protein [Cyclobacteriaceae bacterium]|nr:four helix bundle protein [Cyclobacteriaceae bacterium]